MLDTPTAGVRRITFNRPETYNAFTFDMYRSLLDALRAIQYDTEARVVIVTGAGAGFCSGHDVRTPTPVSWAPDVSVGPHRDLFAMQEIREIPLAMRALPQPVIAAVNGPAAGIGLMFVLAADIAVAARSAKFVNAFHNTGIGSEGGVTYLLPRAIGSQRAAEFLLTGRPVEAEEAAEIGLVLRAVPDDQLMPTALGLAEAMRSNTPLDNWLTKQALHANSEGQSFARAMDLDTRGVALSRTTMDLMERRAALAEGREPTYKYQ
ncbi:enoyl-CoA hydratase-related protein [Streptomyces sp. NPDC051572]|uniref:enoyl-CoA hydratase/isomerase family protein n=1 Tax=unclassified Streptomyces TaxID=2593676 RepID=UPI00344BFB51